MKCGLELGLKSVCALWYVGRQVVKSWLLKDMQLPLHEHCFLLLRRKQLRGISVHASGRAGFSFPFQGCTHFFLAV